MTPKDHQEPTRDELEEALRQARHQIAVLRNSLNTLPSPIFIKDTDGVYVESNIAFLECVGRPAEEVIGKTVFQIWPEELARKYHEADTKLL